MLLVIAVIVVALATKSISDTKVWTYSTAIDDPLNWVDGKVQKDCNGLVFSQIHDMPVFVRNLKIKQLVLPRYGTIWFEEGTTVLFDEESTDDLNCVELVPSQVVYSLNITYWKNLDNPDNPAVPFLEQLPCRYDDVILPKGFNSSMSVVNFISAKSVTFGKEKLTQQEIYDLVNSEAGIDAFSSYYPYNSDDRTLFKITGATCSDPTGCDRRGSSSAIYLFSWNWPDYQCNDFIYVLGGPLHPICGAQILINTVKTGFTIDKLNRKLKEYNSYTHASKYDPGNRIQIIFTEKEFTGSSLIEATEFYNSLRGDDSYFCEDITLTTSGPPLSGNKAYWKNALSIIFGTFLGVILMFWLMFFAYSPTMANLNLRNRLRSARPLSTYILRYDNIEDRADIIDGQSIAGSVLALNRSFENPLYEHAPSTRSTSNETLMSPKLEDGYNIKSDDKTVILDSARELEDVDLTEGISSKNDNDSLKGLLL